MDEAESRGAFEVELDIAKDFSDTNEQVNDFPLYVNAWGSCQYTFAFETYMRLCELEEKLTRDEIIEKLGVVIGKVQSFDGEVLKAFKGPLFTDLEEWAADGEDVACLRVQLDEVRDVTDALHFLRDWAWDLWCAAPYVVSAIFPELNIENVPDAPGFGPKFNVLAQNENNRTGLFCWLLKSYGFVEDDEPFKEWDT